MPRGAPKYLKRGKYAAVRIAGREYHLGTFGTSESRAKYDMLLSSWIAAGRPIPWGGPGAAEARKHGHGVQVGELVTAYLQFAVGYYRKDGKPTSEVPLVKRSMEALLQVHNATRVADFGPSALREVREHLLATDKKKGGKGKLTRPTINKYIDRIKRCFKWGVSEEIVPPSIYHGLTAVDGLRRHRSTAPESEGVFPAPRIHIARAMRHLTRDVATMIRIQILTGARPGEVVNMRPCHIEMRDGLWIYRPPLHKTEHHDRRREVFMGPRAIRILRRWMPEDPKAPVFPSRGGKAWTKDGYRRAITRACERARMRDGSPVDRWNPRQLRKNFGTAVRARFGLDAAQVTLGHSKADTSEIYADIEREKAERVAREMG